jgi:hypothetical protein
MIKKFFCLKSFSAVNFVNFWSSKPWFQTGSGSVFRLKLMDPDPKHRVRLPEAGLPRHLGEDGERVLADLAVLLFAADLEDLLELLLLVLRGGDDDGPVQQVQGHPVR